MKRRLNEIFSSIGEPFFYGVIEGGIAGYMKKINLSILKSATEFYYFVEIFSQ
jgi:hypothetical protein